MSQQWRGPAVSCQSGPRVLHSALPRKSECLGPLARSPWPWVTHLWNKREKPWWFMRYGGLTKVSLESQRPEFQSQLCHTLVLWLLASSLSPVKWGWSESKKAALVILKWYLLWLGLHLALASKILALRFFFFLFFSLICFLHTHSARAFSPLLQSKEGKHWKQREDEEWRWVGISKTLDRPKGGGDKKTSITHFTSLVLLGFRTHERQEEAAPFADS